MIIIVLLALALAISTGMICLTRFFDDSRHPMYHEVNSEDHFVTIYMHFHGRYGGHYAGYKFKQSTDDPFTFVPYKTDSERTTSMIITVLLTLLYFISVGSAVIAPVLTVDFKADMLVSSLVGIVIVYGIIFGGVKGIANLFWKKANRYLIDHLSEIQCIL